MSWDNNVEGESAEMCRCQHRKKETNCQEDNGTWQMDGDGSSSAESCIDKQIEKRFKGLKIDCRGKKKGYYVHIKRHKRRANTQHIIVIT